MTGNAWQHSVATDVLAANGDIKQVAERRNVQRSTVAAASRLFGWPDLDVMRAQLSVPPVAELVREAKSLQVWIPDAVMHAFTVAANDLAKAVSHARAEKAREDAESRKVEEKRAEVEAMRARLAKAEAELAKLDVPDKPKTPKTPRRKGQAKLSPTAEIRLWAKSQGIDCPNTGPIPADVRRQFEAAYPGDD